MPCDDDVHALITISPCIEGAAKALNCSVPFLGSSCETSGGGWDGAVCCSTPRYTHGPMASNTVEYLVKGSVTTRPHLR